MKEIITTFHPKHLLQKSDPKSCKDNTNCILCEKKILFPSNSFYCHACDFHFHQECAKNLMESNLTINHPRAHEHTLTFIRKKNYFNCDVCGKVDEQKMNMYGCLLCDFFVHRNCIYLPKVIKITRHSYCATDSNVCDGKNVQGELEEIISTPEEVASSTFKEVDGKTIIRHFSHEHDLMKFYNDYEDEDEDEDEDERVCQACILPIDIGSFLGCKQCPFALHDACASLPRKMKHILHPHALILQADIKNIKEGFFTCSICDQESCGFMYRCGKSCGFKIDAKCASFAEPFHHKAHKHPLSLLQSSDKRAYKCWGCDQFKKTLAACYDCKFYLDFKCGFIREVVKCKDDPHPLTLYVPACGYSEQTVQSVYARTRTSSMWCVICELVIHWDKLWTNPKFYVCYDCDTTIHTECIIGRYPYLKLDHTIIVNDVEIRTASNRYSRRKCHTCKCTSQDKLVFISTRDNLRFCSIKCIGSYSESHRKTYLE